MKLPLNDSHTRQDRQCSIAGGTSLSLAKEKCPMVLVFSEHAVVYLIPQYIRNDLLTIDIKSHRNSEFTPTSSAILFELEDLKYLDPFLSHALINFGSTFLQTKCNLFGCPLVNDSDLYFLTFSDPFLFKVIWHDVCFLSKVIFKIVFRSQSKVIPVPKNCRCMIYSHLV